MRNTKTYLQSVLMATLVISTAACASTMEGVQKDTEKAVENTAAGVETLDVKAALIADGRVDATNINVDTSASTKTVLLKGSVPTDEQRRVAEAIARDEADGYTINNQLTVVPK
jgi:hyperosmotically inducible protein